MDGRPGGELLLPHLGRMYLFCLQATNTQHSTKACTRRITYT